MTKVAKKITLSEREEKVLKEIAASQKTELRYHQRTTIILEAAKGTPDKNIAHKLNLHRQTISHWRNKWLIHAEKLIALEEEPDNKKYNEALLLILTDEQRPGAPQGFTPEQICQIVSISCEPPDQVGYPVSHWSLPLLKQEVIKRGIVDTISVTQVGRFLKSGLYKTTQSKRLDSYAH